MQILARGSEELGIRLTEAQLDRFQTYYETLADWNRSINLTRITGLEEVQVKHFLDSLTVVLAAPLQPGDLLKVVDVGAGAGFPGLPLKLVFPETELALVESVGKKAGFLEEVISVLELEGVEIHIGRAETLAHDASLRENFDLVLARGLARLPVLAEYTLPFCRVGGTVAALKHGSVAAEIDQASNALRTLGGAAPQVHPVEVTGLTDDRVVVAVDKVAPTPEGFPRRPGIPAKRPL